MLLTVVSDTHIVVRDGKLDFEKARIQALSKTLLTTKETKSTSLVLLGDTFDKLRPSLEEIGIFYQFIETIRKRFTNIYVVPGNHDPLKLWTNLPKTHFEIIDTITAIDNILLVPWEYIHNFTNSLQYTNSSQNILLSHARCSLGSLISEEISMKTLSKHFELVILGDIHQFHSPEPNIHYCSQPSSTTFEPHKEKSKGFLIVDTENLKIKQVHTNLPRRELISCSDKTIGKYKLDKNNLYKLRVTGKLEDLQKIDKSKFPSVLLEFHPEVNHEEVTNSYRETLSKSVYDQLQIHMTKFKFSDSIVTDALNYIKRKRSK